MKNKVEGQKLKTKPNFKRLFGLLRLFGVLLFVLLLFRINLKELMQQLAQTQKHLLFAGLFFQGVVLLAKGIRWHLMNESQNNMVTWRKSLGRFYESYAFGVVTPGRMGELLKAGYEQSTNSMLAVAIRVLAERGLDVGIFVVFAGISVFAGNYLNWPPVYSSMIVFLGLAVAVFSMLLLTSAWVYGLMQKIGVAVFKKANLFGFEMRLYPLGRSLAIVLLSLVSNLSYFVSCYYLALSAQLDVGFVWTSGAVAVSGLINMLPVTIMGMGTRELVFLFVFKAFPQTMVLSFSFLVMLIAQIGGGLIALVAGQLLLLKKPKNNPINHG